MSEQKWTDTQLFLEAQQIVMGRYGIKAVYGVLKMVRDDLTAQIASLTDALKASESLVQATELALQTNISDTQHIELDLERITRLEADNERLRAELQEARAWKNVPDGRYHVDSWRFIVDGGTLVAIGQEQGALFVGAMAPDEWRLQRRVSVAKGDSDGN